MASASSYIIGPFPDFNWSIKSLATFGLARQVLLWVQHMIITGRGKVVFIFWVYVKVGNSWKQKYNLSLASKWKISAGKKIEKICFKYGLHQYLCNEPQTLQPLEYRNIFRYPKFYWRNIRVYSDWGNAIYTNTNNIGKQICQNRPKLVNMGKLVWHWSNLVE